MNTKIHIIFVAGGSGTRMGMNTPKQFLELKGKTVLQRSIESFEEAIPKMKAITVVPPEYLKSWKDYSISKSMTCPQILVPGGLSRFFSVRNALSFVPDEGIVAVHDGVRPFVSANLIRSMVEIMQGGCEALIPVMPITDTLRSIDPSVVSPDRSKLVAVQTPQFFQASVLKKAYTQAYDTTFTDDASVVERMGVKVQTIEGERFNIKLTTKEDLALSEYILTIL